MDNPVEVSKRCGKPSVAEQRQTRLSMFADRLHKLDCIDEIIPFFVR